MGQQKFWFEIPEMLRVQWNGTFRLLKPDASYRAFGYCSCKQDTKERYWRQQFCQMERDISVRPTESGPPLKVVSNILVGPNRNGPFHLMYQKFPSTEGVRLTWLDGNNLQMSGAFMVLEICVYCCIPSLQQSLGCVEVGIRKKLDAFVQ